MKAFPGNRFEGMELRDYFAAKCMPIAHKMITHNHAKSMNNDFEWEFDEEEFEILAYMAYGIADAMMEARKESPQNDTK
jgi:hypothetical protein